MGAERNLFDGQERLDFRFQINGTTHPDNIAPTQVGGAKVADITRISAGVFDITLNHAHYSVDSFVGSVLGATAGGFVVEPVSYSAGVLRIRIARGSTTAAITVTPSATAAWTTGLAVAAHTATLPAAGWVLGVTATTADGAGGKVLQSTAAPAAGYVRVEYTAGVATLTFNATDNVTVASYQMLPNALATAATTPSTAYAGVDPTDDYWVHCQLVVNTAAATGDAVAI